MLSVLQKKRLMPNSIYWIAFIVVSLFSTCSKDDYSKTATVKFESATATYSEDGGTVKIGIQLDRQHNVNTELHAVWTSKDTTTFIGTDFDFGTDLTIKPFTTQAYFQFTIVDDKQIDLNDLITLKITEPIGQNVKLSNNAAETQFDLTITDNDQAVANRLQADLAWHRTNPHDNVKLIDFDLYLQDNVQIANGAITDIGTTFASSLELINFETLTLKDSDPDQEYFLVVYFKLALLQEYADYTLTLNGFGFSNKTFSGKLNDVDVGAAIFYGPFIKSGTSIGGRRKSEELKVYRVDQSLAREIGRK